MVRPGSGSGRNGRWPPRWTTSCRYRPAVARRRYRRGPPGRRPQRSAGSRVRSGGGVAVRPAVRWDRWAASGPRGRVHRNCRADIRRVRRTRPRRHPTGCRRAGVRGWHWARVAARRTAPDGRHIPGVPPSSRRGSCARRARGDHMAACPRTDPVLDRRLPSIPSCVSASRPDPGPTHRASRSAYRANPAAAPTGRSDSS